MSPEQFMGQVVDARTDIYSSGVLLYQMLTGERPFEGGMSAIMHKALNTEPPAPSQLSVTAPPSFDAVVRRAMAKRPEDRFASASAFAEAMRAALAHPAEPAASEDEATMVAPPPVPPPGATATAPPRSTVSVIASAQRSNTPILAAAALLVLGVVGGGWWFFARQPVPPPVIGNTIVPPPQVADTTPARPPVVVTPPIDVPSQAPIQSQPNQSGATTAATPPPQPPTVTPQLPPPVVPPAPAPVVQAPPLQSPPPPVTQQNDQQLAMVGLEVLRRQIAQWVSGRTCALLDGDVRDNRTVTLNGLAGHGSVDELRQGLSSFVPPGQIDLHVTGVNRVFCPALTALRPISPAFGVSGGPRLGLQMADGKTRLHDGERVHVRLVMPDFASRLRVDYIAHDGNVQHLYPQLADPKAAIIADPPRTFEPNEPVSLGHPSWQIGEPYGIDLVIAVASSEPLFERPRPSNAETADVYLRDLQAAIEALRLRGARLAGAAVTLEALP
jgi:serine/threonine-protein kinase